VRDLKNLLLVISISLLMAACGNRALCFKQGEGAHVTSTLGYFYDSSDWAMHGPSELQIIPESFDTNPCPRHEVPNGSV